MSEYWVSTPTYWCKFCQTYVRDTKVSRQQHEATGKHQGAVQRSIRQLQKTQDRESRDQQRAKDEVARLKGASSSGGRPDGPTASTYAKSAGTAASAPPQRAATRDERFRQAEQLAELGVALPDEFRRDMAIAGEWQTVARPVREEKKVDPLSVGVHKRKHEDGEESADEHVTIADGKRAWGSKFKANARSGPDETDFDALLSKEAPFEPAPPGDDMIEDVKPAIDEDGEIKPQPDVQHATDASTATVVFKKRKSKAAKT